MNKQEYIAEQEANAYGKINFSVYLLVFFFLFAFSTIILLKNDDRKESFEKIVETHQQFSNISDKHKVFNTHLISCTENHSVRLILDDDFYFSCVRMVLDITTKNESKEVADKVISDFYDLVINKRNTILNN